MAQDRWRNNYLYRLAGGRTGDIAHLNSVLTGSRALRIDIPISPGTGLNSIDKQAGSLVVIQSESHVMTLAIFDGAISVECHRAIHYLRTR